VLRTAAPALLLVTLAACGGGAGGGTGDQAASDEQYVDTLAAAYRLGDEGFGALSADPARCLATVVVDAMGADVLDQAGVTPVQLADATDMRSLPVAAPEGLAGRIHEAIGTCAVLPELESMMIEAIGAGTGGSMSAENVSCVATAVDDAALSLAFAASMVDEANVEATAQPFFNGFAACPPAAVELLVNAMSAEGTTVSPEGRACIEGVVRNEPAALMAMWTGGDAGADAFGVRLAQVCPAAFM
jgi:hypothetical protein